MYTKMYLELYFQFKVFAQNEVGQTPIEVNVEIRDVNSAPFFVNLRNFTVSEKAGPVYLIGTVTAKDNDTDANFVTVRYTIGNYIFYRPILLCRSPQYHTNDYISNQQNCLGGIFNG